MNKPRPLKVLDIRIPIIIPIKGRAIIKQGSGIVYRGTLVIYAPTLVRCKFPTSREANSGAISFSTRVSA